MNILDAMVSAQGGGAVQQLGRQFGLRDDQVTSALSALVPALAGGLHQNMTSAPGAGGLISALGSGQHQRYAEQADALADPAATADGNSILGQLLGSKDVSRQVAGQAAAQTGIQESVLKSMLPVVAAMMMGTLSRHAGQSGTGVGGANAGLLGMLAPMLDANRDGSVADDVMGMVGKLFNGRR